MRLLAVWIAASQCLLWADGSYAASADPIPALQYRFVAGDHVAYERRATNITMSTGQAAATAVEQIEIWCLQKHGKQSRLLVTFSRTADGRTEPTRGVVLSVDEYGRPELPEVTQSRLVHIDSVLEILPVHRFGLQPLPVWKTPPDLLKRQWRCTLVGPDAQRANQVRVDYTVDFSPELNQAAGRHRRLAEARRRHAGRYWFDADAGLLTRAESIQEDQMADIRVEAVTVLRLRDRRPAGWTAARADEANRFLLTLAHEDRLLQQIVRQPEQVGQTLERLDRLWAGRAADFDEKAESPFAMLCRARRQELAREKDSLRRDAQYARQWLNRPAVPWSLQDGSGRTVTSEELRTGVTVECLWSTAEPWSAATLEMMRDLQRQLADSRIPILCLNLDTDASLAQRAIACLPPGPAQLLAGPLRVVEPPPRLPILRVLDRQGIIRGLWIGWQPSCAAVAEAARQLAQ